MYIAVKSKNFPLILMTINRQRFQIMKTMLFWYSKTQSLEFCLRSQTVHTCPTKILKTQTSDIFVWSHLNLAGIISEENCDSPCRHSAESINHEFAEGWRKLLPKRKGFCSWHVKLIILRQLTKQNKYFLACAIRVQFKLYSVGNCSN